MISSTPTASTAALRRPMVSIWTVVSIIDRSEDHVLRMIDEGKLRFAFDLRQKKSGKQFVRVLSKSVCDFVNKVPAPPISDAEEFDQVVGILFPLSTPMIRATLIARAFNVCNQHVADLIGERSLRLAKLNGCKRAKNESPFVDKASAIQLLRERRII